jgi:hypothetical protein
MDNRTVTVNETFFGEQQEERDFGRSVYDRTEIKAGELFEKYYEEEQNK